jgi:hypothetical protein
MPEKFWNVVLERDWEYHLDDRVRSEVVLQKVKEESMYAIENKLRED